MRATLYILLALALTGCSWFSRKAAESARPVLEEAASSAVKEAVRPPAPASKPAPTPDTLGLWPAIPDLASVAQAIAANPSTPSAVTRAAEIVERSADAASARDIKEAALFEVVRMSAWAMGLGFLCFLLGGFLPFPGIRTAGGWTVALGAAIATLAPWLNDLLGTENARVVGWFAFALLAFALAGGAAWWFLDKVRDAASKE